MATAKSNLSSEDDHGGFKNTAVGTTPDMDVRDGACALKSVRLTESSGTGQCSLKIWDSDGYGVTPGTTAPQYGLPVKASGNIVYEFPDGIAFSEGITVAGAKEDGNAVTTAPDASTEVDLMTTP